MIVSGMLFLILIVGLFFSKGYEADFLKMEKKRLKIPVWLGSFALFLKDRSEILKKQDRRNGHMAGALLIDKNEQRIAEAKRIGMMWLTITAGCVIAFLSAFFAGNKRGITEIGRPVFGEKKTVELEVDGMEGLTEIRFDVTGRVPEAKGMYRIFDDTFEAMKTLWLNGNESFDRVDRDLDFPSKTDSGIKVRYYSDRPDIMSDLGTLFSDRIPDAGAEVRIRIVLSFGDLEKEYDLPVKVIQPVRILTEKEQLEQLILENDESTRKEKSLKLPETLNGKILSYHEITISALLILGLSAALSGLIYMLPNERMKTAYKKRNEALEGAYPGILSKLSILIRAGMSSRMAWEKVVGDYREQIGNCTQKDYAYEEMRLTCLEIESGIAEEEAYVRFGKRCELHGFLKLGNLLSQNLKQGTKGLADMLDNEMMLAFDEKINKALKKGEEAGTRLLFPMMLMLFVVIIVLIVPAFMSF